MPETPPPPFASYPRGPAPTGDPERLQALADGYFGLNQVFVINIVMVLVLRILGATGSLPVVLAGVVFLGVAVAVLTYPKNKRIGEGVGWSPSGALVASILMGINSALCCGIIGYVIVQQIAYKQMKTYGLSSGFFGLKKKAVDEKIAELRGQV